MKAYQHLAWTAAAVCALASTPAAASQLFEGSLSGAQENPAVMTPATGFGSILLSDDMNSITVNLSWTGLTAPAVAAHVHCCVPTGMNGPVCDRVHAGLADDGIAQFGIRPDVDVDL